MMESSVLISVISKDKLWDIIRISKDSIKIHDQELYIQQINNIQDHSMKINHTLKPTIKYFFQRNNESSEGQSRSCQKTISAINFRNEGLHFCVFLKEMQISSFFRISFLKKCNFLFKNKFPQRSKSVKIVNSKGIIFWELDDNICQIIDTSWCLRMNYCALERQHLDYLMSWLSTLGGACSALGDYSQGFALRAGAISVKQMELALKVGDPALTARCRLYASISLIQQNKYKMAIKIIKDVYGWAKSLPESCVDQRIIRMCQGIWTKLRHEYSLNQCKQSTLSSRAI